MRTTAKEGEVARHAATVSAAGYAGKMTTAPIHVLDLFAGAGGLTAGFHAASGAFRSVAAVEFDVAAAASYAATFGAGIVYPGDIADWLKSDHVPSKVDVIIGGPPCQGFSTLGKQEVEDERNSLWRHYAETIRRTAPSYFVVENVAAFAKSPQFGEFKETIETGFLRDYAFEVRVLNSADYGAPQARKRAVMIGHRRGLPFPGFPEVTHRRDEYVDVRSALRGIPFETRTTDLPSGRVVEFAGKELPGHFTASELHIGRDYTQLSKDRFKAIPLGGNRFDLPEHLLSVCWRKHRSGSGDVMGRLHWDKPSVTIRTEFFKPEKGRYIHPEANRAITHYEAAVLQGFPRTHKFVGSKTAIARQIGNAVPIPLGKAIAEKIAAAPIG